MIVVKNYDITRCADVAFYSPILPIGWAETIDRWDAVSGLGLRVDIDLRAVEQLDICARADLDAINVDGLDRERHAQRHTPPANLATTYPTHIPTLLGRDF